MGATIVTRLQTLAEPIRNRLLVLLEHHELTVGELCEALQLPQSTVSRHLKVLADDGWVTSRADGASRLYRMRLADLEPAARRLWQVVREQVEQSPPAARDSERLRSVLAERRSRSEEFFASAAGQWDRMRAELFGSRTELLPLLGLLDPAATIADLGCGTGQLSLVLSPFVGQVIAVDASAAMLRSARARLGGLPNVEIRRGELEALPIDDASLDVAFLVLVLPYVAAPAQIVREAARALRPGGRLLVTDLMPHERSEYRQTLGHQWQGFEEGQVLGWFRDAGLGGGMYRGLAPEASARGPLLFTAAARRER
ncbi:MAG TPA: metalloregulator ArsR/SmtB family transcription factor [Gemmatimonadales bacterium]|nr:metalloregulator ArsR/SmtB family transcription factor [Gemmatimonadales bacterium]